MSRWHVSWTGFDHPVVPRSRRRPSAWILAGALSIAPATIVAGGVTGAEADEALTCGGLAVTVNWAAGERATEGDDVIAGGDYAANEGVIHGYGGNDTICAPRWTAYMMRIDAGPGEDRVLGGDVGRVDGGEGDDALEGHGALLDGGSGHDELRTDHYFTDLVGGDGNDRLVAGEDGGELSGGAGNDTIQLPKDGAYADGGAGDDTITGDVGEDRIRGGSGTDVIVGAGGADHLWGDVGVDSVQGGPGADVIYMEFVEADAVAGDDGQDRLDLGRLPVAADVDLSVGRLKVGDLSTTATGFENVAGSAFDDVIGGSDADEELDGGQGDDVIEAGAGSDRIHGWGGSDTISGGAGADRIYGDGGADAVTAGPGADYVSGGYDATASGWDRLDGGDDIDLVEFTGPAVDFDLATGEVAVSTSRTQVLGFEQVMGTPENDRLTGTAGSDIMFGGGGDDTIHGLGGDDTIDSDNPGVTLYAPFSGADQIDGGDGNDRLGDHESSSSADVYFGNDGDDDLFLTGYAVTVHPGEGNDRITVGEEADARRTTLSYDDVPGPISVDMSANAADVAVTGAGADVVHRRYSSRQFRLVGTPADDVIVGDERLNVLVGGGGDDVIRGLGDDDVVEGGSGDDQIDLGAGTSDDVVYTSAPGPVHISLDLVTAQDTLSAGRDTISNAETVIGSAYEDVLRPSAAGSALSGGAGLDTLYSGPGDDWFADPDSVISYQESPEPVTLIDNQVSGHGNDGIWGPISQTRRLIGSAYDDALALGNLCHVEGGSGDDTIDMRASAQPSWRCNGRFSEIYDASGGPGNDTFLIAAAENGWRAEVGVEGGSGDDTLSFAEHWTPISIMLADRWFWSSDLSLEASAVENVVGTRFADSIVGDAGSNRLDGGGGTDDVDGGGGADTLSGGPDNDTITFDRAASGVTANVASGTFAVGGSNGAFTQFERVVGSKFGDWITGSSAADALVGGAGADRISGGDGRDVIEGGVGGDVVYGDAGDDRISGDGDGDTLDGGPGADTVRGGSGDDTVSAIDQSDTLLAGDDGNDTLNYAGATSGVTASLASTGRVAGFDNIVGSKYGDKLVGNPAANVLDGGGGNDRIEGGAGGDRLTGGDGADTLLGGDSGDWISGGSGNDTVQGGSSADSIDTGAGNDTLVADADYRAAAGDQLRGGTGIDTVTYAALNRPIVADLTRVKVKTSGSSWSTHSLSGIENLTGSPYGDQITGSSGANRLYGGPGGDVIKPGAGTDFVDAGGGRDTLSYAGLPIGVSVSLAVQSAQSTGGGGHDTIRNFENLVGTAKSDVLKGNGIANLLTGLSGNDRLYGYGGADRLDGGLGRDYGNGGTGQDRWISIETKVALP